MTKSSDLDKLHTIFTKELTRQLQDKDERPNAALLSVVGAFLFRSGTKATSDSPSRAALARAYADLPFSDADEQRSEKAPH
jgi:hypothetical protein